MPSEWAIEETKKMVERYSRQLASNPTESYFPLVCAALDAARAQGRRDGLEEAAMITLESAVQMSQVHEVMARGADRVAIAIRARIAQEPTA